MSPRSAAITACCVLAFSLLTACGQEATQVAAPSDSAPPATPSGNDADLARAQAAAQAFSSQLQQRLQGAMKDDGPVAAVDVIAPCRRCWSWQRLQGAMKDDGPVAA